MTSIQIEKEAHKSPVCLVSHFLVAADKTAVCNISRGEKAATLIVT